MNPTNLRLSSLLTSLYPNESDSALVMTRAGIEAGRIHAQQQALTRWFSIVQEAEKSGLVAALFGVALADYPQHTGLLALQDEIGVPLSHGKLSRVLAIWPEAPGRETLDTLAEAAALYAAGLDYVPLYGAAATRDGVVREWGRVKPTIVEIGAHGVDGKILLSDGPADVGWWTRLLHIHQPQLVLLLACKLADSGALDIPDAFLRAGVQDVIAVSDLIRDTDAVLFARVFLENLTAPKSVGEAVAIAKLVLTDAGANVIRHRQAVST